MKSVRSITPERLDTLLTKMASVKALSIGDLCLDVYWFADMTKSELSRETPHHPLPIVRESYSAGAGGNAVVNLAALNPQVAPIGVVGCDWRGECLLAALKQAGVSTDRIIRSENHITNAYCKPMRIGYAGVPTEDPRLDFEMRKPLDKETEDALLETLEKAVPEAQLLCVSDQFTYGCITPRVREAINRYAANGLLTVVDSRDRIKEYRHAILKPNEIECARALGLPDATLSEEASEDELLSAATALASLCDASVCLTLGKRGSLFVNGGKAVRAASVFTPPPVDTVGAGDTFLSALSLALAAGAEPYEAALLGALASSVSVGKLHTTGSATAEEIRARYTEATEAK